MTYLFSGNSIISNEVEIKNDKIEPYVYDKSYDYIMSQIHI